MDRLITAAPALVPAIGLLVVGIWAIAHAIFGGRTRHDMRRLEHYANNPNVRARYRRKEKPQP